MANGTCSAPGTSPMGPAILLPNGYPSITTPASGLPRNTPTRPHHSGSRVRLRRAAPTSEKPPIGAALTRSSRSLVDHGRARTWTGHEPDERDDAPSDQGVDRHRDQRLWLENRSAFLRGVEDAMEGRNQRPGQVVHEADKGSRIRAEQLQHEANGDQDIDETDDPPDGLDGTAVVAALAVDSRPRGCRGRCRRHGRRRCDGPHRLARARLLSDDFAIV